MAVTPSACVGRHRAQRRDFHGGQLVPGFDEVREGRRRISEERETERLVCHEPADDDFDASLGHVAAFRLGTMWPIRFSI